MLAMQNSPTGLDPQLALRSLDAAQEIDRWLNGQRANEEIWKQLALELSKASELGAFESFDPSTTEVFAQTAGATCQRQNQDLTGLAEIMRELIAPLTANLRPRRESLELVRNFCLAFHRSMTAHSLSPLAENEEMPGDELGFV